MRHLLVFEPDARGHALEWLTYLVRCTRGLDIRLSLAVAPKLVAPLAQVIEAESIDAAAAIGLDRAETEGCLDRRLVTSAAWRWRSMGRYARSTGADTGLFLSIDHLSLPLALQFPTGDLRLAGILFRPSVHYATLGPYRPTRQEILRDIRKRVLYPAMLRHRALKAVFSLDPYFPSYARRHYRYGRKVEAIPDPISPDPLAPKREDAAPPPSEQIRFLLFGSLTARKGVLVLLEALAGLKTEIARKIALVVAGEIEPAIHDRLLGGLRRLSLERPEMRVRLIDRWLADREIADLVVSSDVVLAPYQRFVGSSGVLLWAAKHGRPVVTQDYGLLGRLVRDHRLGVAVDTENPSILADAIGRIVREGSAGLADPAGMARFVSHRAPGDFVAAIFDRIAQGENGPIPGANAAYGGLAPE